LAWRSRTRRRGAALHAERQPWATIEQIRRTIGEYNFAWPIPAGPGAAGRRHGQGGVVQELRAQRTAGEIKPDHTKLIKGKDPYLLHMLRKRLEYLSPSGRWAISAEPSRRMLC
jgi:hypothetical protein